MKRNIFEIIGTLIIFIFIITFFILIILEGCSKVLYSLNIKNELILTLSKESSNNIRIIDWEKLYPFKSKDDYSDETNNVIEKINLKIDTIKNKIENLSSKGIIGYERFLEISYIYDKVLNYSLVNNNDDLSRININGYICRLHNKTDKEKLICYSKNLKEFRSFLINKNIDFLYVQEPYKIEKNNYSMSKIYYDDTNDITDEFLNNIADYINYLDLRESIKIEGIDYLNLFFKTDHHWKPETGIWATGEIIKKLNNEYGFNIDEQIANLENYNINVYENSYLGSDGRYVTLANTEKENISIITPKVDTELKVKMPDLNIDNEGKFEDVLMDYSKLECTDIYKSHHYTVYGYGYMNRPLIEIQNKKVNDDKKVLFIRDSYASVVAPFFALGVENCAIIDLRTFTGSVKEYINQYNPDIVVVAYYGGTLTTDDDEMWNFE